MSNKKKTKTNGKKIIIIMLVTCKCFAHEYQFLLRNVNLQTFFDFVL